MYVMEDIRGMHRSRQSACNTQRVPCEDIDCVSPPHSTPPPCNSGNSSNDDDVCVIHDCWPLRRDVSPDTRASASLTSQASPQELDAFVSRSALLRACELADFFCTALWLFTEERGDITPCRQPPRQDEAASPPPPFVGRADVLLREAIETAYSAEDAMCAAQRKAIERALCGSGQGVRVARDEGAACTAMPSHEAGGAALTRQLQCAAYTGRFAQLRQEQLASLRQSWQRVDLTRATARHDECALLVGDLVRYARLVLAWRTTNELCHGPRALCAPPEAKATMPTGATVSFGDAGALLYGRYPPPLLRCGSLAQETCRLLKWLRTWRRPACEERGSLPRHATPARERRTHGQRAGGKRGTTRAWTRGKRARPTRHAVPSASSTQTAKRPRTDRTAPAGQTKASSEESAMPPPPPAQHEAQPRQPGEWAARMYGALWERAVTEGVADGMQKASLPSSPSLVPDAMHPPCSPTAPSAPLPPTARARRRGSALPFSDELAREGVLGSTAEVYYDSYGNRLRSARQARQDVTRLARAARRRRRREQQRGYFTHAAPNASAAPWWTLSANDTGDFGFEPGPALPRSASASACSEANSSSSESDSDSTSSSSSSSPVTSSSSSSSCSSSSLSEAEEEAGSFTNIAVVYGRTGVGKTAAVYVAAQLLGFRVVEMNSAVQRGAASVERLLAELTRSHRLGQLGSHTLGGQDVEQELQRLKKEQQQQQQQGVPRRPSTEVAAVPPSTSPVSGGGSGGGGAGAATRRRERRKANAISVEAINAFFAPRAAASSGNTPTEGADKHHNNHNSKMNDSKDMKGGAEGSHDAVDAEVAEEEEVVVTMDRRARCCAGKAAPPCAAAEQGTPSAPPAALGQSRPGQTTAGTVLLFEDADLMLGEESARGFYAAVRELAQTSNIPIVVTVSAPAASPRYSYACGEGLAQPLPHRTSVADRMSALCAAAERLEGGRAVAASATHGAAHDTHGVHVHRSEASACSVTRPAPAAAGALCNEGCCPSASNNNTNNKGVLQITFSAAAATQYFGPHTAFTTVQPTSHAALLGQLMVIAMVELGLCSLSHHGISAQVGEDKPRGVHSCDGSDGDRTVSLVVHDVPRFRAIADTLCAALFAQPTSPSMLWRCPACALSHTPALPRLRTTTDVRFWLNQLQYYMLRPACCTGLQPSTAAVPPAVQHRMRADELLHRCSHNDMREERHGGDDVEAAAVAMASAWDCCRGRFAACLAYNDRHCVRQQRFDHTHLLRYTTDVLDEVMYERAIRPRRTAPVAVHEDVVDVDENEEEEEEEGEEEGGRGSDGRRSSERRKTCQQRNPWQSTQPRNEVLVEDANYAGREEVFVEDTLPPHAESCGSAEVVSPASRPPVSTLCATPLATMPRSHSLAGQSSLRLSRGHTRSPSVHTFSPEREPDAAATAAATGSVEREEGMFACTAVSLRPVELLLPYGPAQSFFFPAERDYRLGEYSGREPVWVLSPATSSASSGSTAGGSAVVGGRSGEGGEKDTVVGRRMKIVRALWTKPRKAESVRTLCAGRTTAAFEDVMGFTLLFASSTPTAGGSSS